MIGIPKPYNKTVHEKQLEEQKYLMHIFIFVLGVFTGLFLAAIAK